MSYYVPPTQVERTVYMVSALQSYFYKKQDT
jgi:hypothetical protein